MVRLDELDSLSFKYFAMRHGGGQEPELMTNVTMTEELTAALKRYRALTSEEFGASRGSSSVG